MSKKVTGKVPKETQAEAVKQTQEATPKSADKKMSPLVHVHNLRSDRAIKLSFAEEDQDDTVCWAVWKARALTHILRDDPPEDEDDRSAILCLLELEIDIIGEAYGSPCKACAEVQEEKMPA